MNPCVLAEATDAARFGGKAAGLAHAIAAGLPVPPGIALEPELVERLCEDARAEQVMEDMILACGGGAVAVRSSAIGEDGAAASFAGQHATRLGARTGTGALAALREVLASATSGGALAYRRRLGLPGVPRMAAIVQQIVEADVAGVMFTRNPTSGADERVVEAAWGLGEAVVQGIVTPDSWRIARGGRVLEARVGVKDVAVVLDGAGATREAPVEDARARQPCLDGRQLVALERLAAQCERVFAGARDLEWAFAGEKLWLLQCRAVTR
jgi:pyruvate,water dikinase